MAKPGPPEGYTSLKIHELTAAKVRAGGDAGTWRKPIHGTAVLVTDAGAVLGAVRTLGIMLPVKDRRYALRINGATFTRIVPLLSATKPIQSDLAPYDTMEAARKAGSAIIAKMLKGDT